VKSRARASQLALLIGRAGGTAGLASVLALALCALAILLYAPSATAKSAWVRGEIRLNVRTGPGTQFRIVGMAKTGDGVEVLSIDGDWEKVRLTEEGVSGWIPVGYLEAEPPPALQLERTQARAERLASDLDTLQTETGELRRTHEIIASQNAEQEAIIKKLTVDNLELRAGARYPEWITGASILAAGMTLGAILHRSSGRRAPKRIRL
jgi:uncharacterized protein YgiM (DUF1202 family)